MAKYAILGQKNTVDGTLYQVVLSDDLNHIEQRTIFVSNEDIETDILAATAREHEKIWAIRIDQDFQPMVVDTEKLKFIQS